MGGGDPAENTVGGIARTTGNVTGSETTVSLGGKWLELLKRRHRARRSRVYDPELSLGELYRTAIDAAAAQLAITTIRTPVRNPDEIARAINAFAAEPNGGLLMTGAYPEKT